MFVHGCFWHGHLGCPKATVPARNRKFWADKFAANKARDARAVRALRKAGFVVAVVWQCEVEQQPARVRLRLERLLGGLEAQR